VLATIPVGETITLGDAYESGFTHMEYKGVRGWIHKRDMNLAGYTDAMGFEQLKGTVKAENGTPIYALNFDNAEIIGTLPFGVTVEFPIEIGWETVDYKNEIGKIHGWVKLQDFTLSYGGEQTPAAVPPNVTAPQTAEGGVVHTTPLEEQAREKEPDDDQTASSTAGGIYWWIIIAVAVVGIILLVRYLRKAKCPKCNARNAYRLSSTATGETERIYLTEKEVIKEYTNEKGLLGEIAPRHAHWGQAPDKIVEREVKVPGTRTYYSVTYKCKKCGEEFSRTEYVDRKD
jgi:predicted nucleic-acid-binding Zn-ribbon protein